MMPITSRAQGALQAAACGSQLGHDESTRFNSPFADDASVVRRRRQTSTCENAVMRPEEALAQRIIEAVEVGARMVYREDQSIRIHDFDLHHASGSLAAVEVTSVNDGVVRATYTAIDRCRHIPRKLCSKDWRIHPAPNVRHKRLVRDADIYLARIEAEGIEEFFGPRDAADSPSVAAILRDLRVMGGSVFPWQEPGIGIALPVTGGAVGVSLIDAAVEEIASKPDNVEKLVGSGAAERHLAIYVHDSATTALMALRDFSPPSDAPDLPGEVYGRVGLLRELWN